MSGEAPLNSVLLVDDDQAAVEGMKRVLGPRFTVTAVRTAIEAIEQLDTAPGFSVVVVDIGVHGVKGVGVLRHARMLAPDTVRILLADGVRLPDAFAAINDGQVFRALVKPIQSSVFMAAVTAACEQHRQVVAERRALEETLHGSVQALSELFLLGQPAAFGRAIRLRRHVSDLASAMGITWEWDIEVAALLSQIGCVALPVETLDRWYHGRPLTPEEMVQIERLPVTAAELVANIPGLDGVQQILRCQDHSAAHGNLPAGARMLAIARDFDLLFSVGQNADEALATMEGRCGRYDVVYLHAFRAIRGSDAPRAAMREVRLSEVTEAMTLASDVHSPRGLLLIARGQRITTRLLHRIQHQWNDFAGSCAVRVVMTPEAPTAGPLRKQEDAH
jgi:response regulator RpfG family c-di-GMP phosphodiesterase